MTRLMQFLLTCVVCLTFVAAARGQYYYGPTGPAPTDDPRPSKPEHPAAESPEKTKQNIEKLIDELANLSGFDASDLNISGVGPFTPLDDAKAPSPFYEQVNQFPVVDTIRKLVSYGADAVPLLVEHLGDQRATKLLKVSEGYPQFWREYDYNWRLVENPPKNFHHPDESPSTDAVPADFPEEYTVTVGDLCFVALGQIVNRNFNAVQFQPQNSYLITPVSSSPEYRKVVTDEWGGLTKEKHKASLIADFSRPDTIDRPYEALKRLAYYYPETVEELALERLAKPRYSWTKMQAFAGNQLYQAATPEERKQLHDAAIQQFGDAFSEGLLGHLISQAADWDKLSAGLRYKTDPTTLLAELYPDVDATQPYFSEAEPWGNQPGVFDALAWFPSEKIDQAAYDLFKKLGQDTHAPVEDDQIALGCIRRLAKKNKEHDKEFEAYLVRRIPQIEKEWETDELLAPLALLRGETFIWTLDDEQITDAEMARLKSLKNPQRLYISGPQLTDERAKYLYDLTSPKTLFLASDNITDDAILHCRRMKDLEDLGLEGPKITDAAVDQVKMFGKLKKLGFYGADLTDKGLAGLGGLGSLEEMILEGSPKITDAGMEHLQKLGRLKYLNLSGAAISDAGLERLKKLSKLEYLGLDENAKVTKAGVESFQKALPDCRIDLPVNFFSNTQTDQ